VSFRVQQVGNSVATGDATTRLSDGQWVTVDGSGGFVEVKA
jgi:hypothetical protein